MSNASSFLLEFLNNALLNSIFSFVSDQIFGKHEPVTLQVHPLHRNLSLHSGKGKTKRDSASANLK